MVFREVIWKVLNFSFFLLLLQNSFIAVISAEQNDKDAYESLKKKSVLDYTDADIERLYEQWEVGVNCLRHTAQPVNFVTPVKFVTRIL